MTLAIAEKTNGNGNGKEIAKRPAWQDRIMQAIPHHVDRERFLWISLAVLKDMGHCTEGSVLSCIYQAAKLGLVPDPHLGHCYLVARNDKNEKSGKKVATLQIGYRGFIELARRSGRIGAIITDIVFQGEDFTQWTDERGRHLRHVPSFDTNVRADLSKAIATYCIADLAGSWPQVTILAYEEALSARKYATTQMVWDKHEAEMVLKTVVRRASKLWPLSPELAKAVALDEQLERGEAQQLDEFDPPTAPQTPQRKRIESLVDPEPENGQQADEGNDGPPEYDPGTEQQSNEPELPPERQELPAPAHAQADKPQPAPLTYEQFDLRAIDWAITNKVDESRLRAAINKWILATGKKGKENLIPPGMVKIAWDSLIEGRGHFVGLIPA
jgi:recombination protein RecT